MATKQNNIEEINATADDRIEEINATADDRVEEINATADDRVEVFIPKGYANDEPNLFVSVNCVNYILPKGKTSKVPPHIAYEINRSLKAQQMQDENIDMMTAKPE